MTTAPSSLFALLSILSEGGTRASPGTPPSAGVALGGAGAGEAVVEGSCLLLSSGLPTTIPIHVRPPLLRLHDPKLLAKSALYRLH